MASAFQAGAPPPPGLINRLRRLGAADAALCAEAVALLALSAVAIRLAPFARVGRLASWPLRRRAPRGRETLAARVSWTVAACARRAPWRAVCFQQALAAQIMLRRRGVDATLYFGAAPDEANGVAAHVWVRDGERAVIGCESADRFAVLAVFPASAEPRGGRSPNDAR